MRKKIKYWKECCLAELPQDLYRSGGRINTTRLSFQ